MERRLAAILAADVFGYSRLIGENEAETLTDLKSHREALVDPKITEYNGRIVKQMGDGLLTEFFSAVEAVRCAADIQTGMIERNSSVPDNRKISFRIGINIGDIVIEDDDIFGDGVIIAARLEGLANPGGICIAANVYDQLEGKTHIVFEDGGEQTVKNIAKPVGIWHWVVERNKLPILGPALPGKPSIAVLPFNNMSDDPEQEFFADGMAEDIIMGLSRYRWLFVIARNSSFSYKGRTVAIRQIANELGVRYIVEGSVRKSGSRIRVTAQLNDATNGWQIWSERYDRGLTDIFILQDEITETIISAIEPELSALERKRARQKPRSNLDAWDSYQRGLSHFFSGATEEARTNAKRWLRRACQLDPEFSPAFADLAWILTLDITLGLTDRHEETLIEAEKLAVKAVDLDARDPSAFVARGRVRILKHLYDQAISDMENALALNSSFDRAYIGLGFALLYSGQPEDSIPQFERALRLNPRGLRPWTCPQLLSCAYFKLGNFEQAEIWANKAVQQPKAPFMPFVHAAAILSNLDRISEARTMISEAKARKPDFSIDTVHKTVGLYGEHSGAEQIVDALRKTGLSD